nr:Protein F29B9.11 [Haemonchus contortus]
MNRAILSLCRQAPVLRRALHKGVDSTPPMRWTSVPERLTLFMLITVSFLSYPTYVLLRLDQLRPKPDNALSPEVQEQIDAMRAARKY